VQIRKSRVQQDPQARPCQTDLPSLILNGRESGQQIEPCNMERRIHHQANQRDELKVGAGRGLDGIGGQRGVLAASGLVPRQVSQKSIVITDEPDISVLTQVGA
jgi:hypothetical protein